MEPAISLSPIQSLTAEIGLRSASDTERRPPIGDASAARFNVGAYSSAQVRRVTRITISTRPAGISRRAYSTGAALSSCPSGFLPSGARGWLIPVGLSELEVDERRNAGRTQDHDHQHRQRKDDPERRRLQSGEAGRQPQAEAPWPELQHEHPDDRDDDERRHRFARGPPPCDEP